jgi:hypothetical protein
VVFDKDENDNYVYQNKVRTSASFSKEYDEISNSTYVQVYDPTFGSISLDQSTDNGDWNKIVFVNNSDSYNTPFIVNYYRDTNELEIESVWDGDFLNQEKKELQLDLR